MNKLMIWSIVQKNISNRFFAKSTLYDESTLHDENRNFKLKLRYY